jgi:hypothetical protein
MELKTGDRVRFSQHGIESMSPKKAERIGVVVNNPQHPRTRYVYVKWDGYKGASVYAPHFIEKAEVQES